jgi:hypothetical protein
MPPRWQRDLEGIPRTSLQHNSGGRMVHLPKRLGWPSGLREICISWSNRRKYRMAFVPQKDEAARVISSKEKRHGRSISSMEFEWRK